MGQGTMKLIDTNIQVEKVGTLNSIEFGIKFDAKMAALLGDRLYSNKIQALIRELSCNAADSHIEAKNNKPFDVQLPGRFDPIFVIRDYGTGLTPKQIIEVYTIYGVSDKISSNKLTGCLGLGSKTPVCYNTKTAIIDSYVDGKHWSYQFHLGEKGIPCLTQLLEEDSIEPNGVKITIPVSPQDIYTFQQEAIKVYRWFDNKPNVIPQLLYPIATKILEYETTKQTSILMGNVLYPVEKSIIPKDLWCLYDCNFVIRVKMGEVEPAISREQLSYTDHTKKTIIKYLEKIKTNLLVRDIYKGCTTYHQARLTWINSGLPAEFISLFKFNNQEINLEVCNNSLLRFNKFGNFENTGKYRYNRWYNYPIYKKDIWNAKQRLKDQNENCYLLFNDTKEIMDQLKLTPSDLLLSSSVPYTKKQRQKLPDLPALKFEHYKWRSYRIKLTDNIVYTINKLTPYSIDSMVRKIQKIDSNFKIYYLNKGTVKKIQNLPNYQPLNDYIQNLINNHNNNLINYDKYLAITNYSLVDIIENINKMPIQVQQELKEYIGIQFSDVDSTLANLASEIGLFNRSEHKILKEFKSKYKILEYLHSYTPIDIVSKCLECNI